MTPKEKAKELVFKYESLDTNDNFFYSENFMDWAICKECALICVDEILKEKERHVYDSYYLERRIDYWEKVKQEIEKL